MDVLVFLYNVVLILLYGVAMIYSFIVFRLKKYPFCIYLSILFLFYIFDNTVISMTEFLQDFSEKYDASFMSVPAFKTVIVIVTAFCLINIFNLIFRKSISKLDYFAVILLSLWDLFVPLLPDSALMVWLYYLPYQLFTFYLSSKGLLTIRRDKNILEQIPFLKKFNFILISTLLFSILIVIEDTIVIFNFDIYKDILVKINNRSITEDLLSIIYAIFFIYHLSNELTADAFAKEPVIIDIIHETEKTANSDDDHFYHFFKAYNFTTREQDITQYLLENKTIQEISELLFISIGTVKTHIHNIYQKANVTKRSQLIQKYQEWLESH